MIHLPTPKNSKKDKILAVHESRILQLYRYMSTIYRFATPFCFHLKIHVMHYGCKTEEKIRERYTRSTGKVEKNRETKQQPATPNNITINNSLMLPL